MSVRTELENEIQELQNRIVKAQEKLDHLDKTGSHVPDEDEFYYYVTSACTVDGVFYSSRFDVDAKRIKACNSFSSLEEAQMEAEKILVRRMLENIASRLSGEEKIDWNRPSQCKYYLYYDTVSNSIDIEYTQYTAIDTVYCLSPDFKSVAIQAIGEERLVNYFMGRYE